MDNLDIARIFEEVADLLDVQEENPFRIRAYRTAAKTLASLSKPISALVSTGSPAERRDALAELPGIGKDLAGKILEIMETGDLGLRKELGTQVPGSVAEFAHLPGVGPKRAQRLYHELGVTTRAGLSQAARSGQLQRLPGFGPKLQAQILKGCMEQKVRSQRFSLREADSHARSLIAHLQGTPGLRSVEVAGSYRRRQETVGDLDLLATTTQGPEVAERFLGYPGFREILARGESKCMAVLRAGMQVDLRIVPPESAGAALLYFTGGKAHSIALRTRAIEQGLKLSEYGLFRGARQIAGRTEEEIYQALGLPWISPELREDHGELEAAEVGRLPRLITRDDLRGDLHLHTRYSDGANSVGEMVKAARSLGYEYVAITDHTQAVRVAGGLDAAGFRKQAREIDLLRRQVKDLYIFKGAEVDILQDGSLDLDEDTLARLDVVLVSIHSRFNMTEQKMTERVLRALRHPRVHVFTHPTGRLLDRREPYAIDVVQIARAARDLGVLLEVNGQPDRLDLRDLHIRMAREAGARLVVSSDAHRTQDLGNVGYGIDQARRGWCLPEDVANTYPLAEFRQLLSARCNLYPPVAAGRSR